MNRNRCLGSGLAALALLLGAALAHADDRHGGDDRRRGDERHGRRGEHLDNRYRHNHYYPARGAYARELPERAVVTYRSGARYYYSGGVWYAPRGPTFIVVAAPIGIFVPVLPPFYTTLWVGGLPYYYANDTYYAWRGDQSGYEVVEPPAGEQAASTQAPPSDELYVYPQNGQSDEQQSTDKYECHKWASTQTGFDPTQSAGGVPPEQTQAKSEEYQRVQRACLEGRGYSVR